MNDLLIISRFARRAIAMCALTVLTLAAIAIAEPVVLLTADGEGHAFACSTCPNHQGLGGLPRRATALAQARASNASSLLLDAGNWLVGIDSLQTRGRVIVAAYDALGYDAVNLTPKDLYWGKVQTLALLKDAKFAVVSANLLDEQTGAPLVLPFVVKTVGGQKIAILGVSETPAGLAMLPHVRQQLAGVRIRDIEETIDEWLPKAKAQADRVLILYHGRAKGLRALRAKLKGSGVMILASGVRPQTVAPVSDDGEPPVMAAEEHGKSIARAVLGAEKIELTQVMLMPDVAADPAMDQLLASHSQPVSPPARPAPAPADAHPAAPTASASASPTESGTITLRRIKAVPAPELSSPPPAQAATQASPDPSQSSIASPESSPTSPQVPAPVTGSPATTAPAPPAPKARFCTSCGARLLPEAKFCTSCGAKIAP